MLCKNKTKKHMLLLAARLCCSVLNFSHPDLRWRKVSRWLWIFHADTHTWSCSRRSLEETDGWSSRGTRRRVGGEGGRVGVGSQGETGGSRWRSCTATGFRDQAQQESELRCQEWTRRRAWEAEAAGVLGQQRVRDGGMEEGREGGMDGWAWEGWAQSGRSKRKKKTTGSSTSAPTTIRGVDVSLSAANHRSWRDKQVCLRQRKRRAEAEKARGGGCGGGGTE